MFYISENLKSPYVVSTRRCDHIIRLLKSHGPWKSRLNVARFIVFRKHSSKILAQLLQLVIRMRVPQAQLPALLFAVTPEIYNFFSPVQAERKHPSKGTLERMQLVTAPQLRAFNSYPAQELKILCSLFRFFRSIQG